MASFYSEKKADSCTWYVLLMRMMNVKLFGIFYIQYYSIAYAHINSNCQFVQRKMRVIRQYALTRLEQESYNAPNNVTHHFTFM